MHVSIPYDDDARRHVADDARHKDGAVEYGENGRFRRAPVP